MVYVQLLTGTHPYANIKSIMQVGNSIVAGVRPSFPDSWQAREDMETVMEVIQRCWRPERDARPSMEEVIQHL